MHYAAILHGVRGCEQPSSPHWRHQPHCPHHIQLASDLAMRTPARFRMLCILRVEAA